MVCSRETSVLEEPGWICDCTKAGACISRNKMLAVCRNELHLGDSRRTGLEIPLICWAVLIMQVLSEICLFVFLNTCPAWFSPWLGWHHLGDLLLSPFPERESRATVVSIRFRSDRETGFLFKQFSLSQERVWRAPGKQTTQGYFYIGLPHG